jgi:hypothetical protein
MTRCWVKHGQTRCGLEKVSRSPLNGMFRGLPTCAISTLTFGRCGGRNDAVAEIERFGTKGYRWVPGR